ncbi:MAG: ABC transporter substrate-binding protein [Anaerobacillus sp.]|uniref:ABC transporter substrate-binding protein n=1 Tax=Anaerobacillus sp. TaxID=1872506 RepID=UPI00391D3841
MRTPIVRLTANEQYWDKKKGPRLSEVVFRNDLAKNQALNLCLNTEGEVDIVTMVDPADAKKVIQSQFANLIQVNANRVLTGIFNRYQQDVDFNDKRLRYALNAAVSKARVVAEGFLGYATAIPSLTPPWSREFPEDISPIEHDPQLAKQLLDEVGWPEERPLTIATLSQFTQSANVMAMELEASLQIKVNVIVIPKIEENKWLRAVAEKRRVPGFDIFLADVFAFFTQGIPAYVHREFFGQNGAFRLGPEIIEFEQLFKEFKSEVNDVRRSELAKDIDRYVHKEALGLFLCCPQDLYAVNRHVQFQAYRSTFELVDTEVTAEHWSRRR